MNPLLPRFVKLGQGLVQGLTNPDLTKTELKTIKEEIEAQKPTTMSEKAVTELAGRSPTSGQLKRKALIAAGTGLTSHALGTLIENVGNREAKESIGKLLLKPRAIARSAVLGTLFGAAVPVSQRLADIEAAKKGNF